MRKVLAVLLFSLLIWSASCTIFEQAARDPNSVLNQTVDAVEPASIAVRDTAPAAGPVGWAIGLAAALLTGGIGTYKSYRSSVQANNKCEQVKEVTRSVIAAIDAVSSIPLSKDVAPSRDGTLGGAVKMKVSEVLQANDLDVIGKAVISELKAQNNVNSGVATN